jgi:hypothetical protein
MLSTLPSSSQVTGAEFYERTNKLAVHGIRLLRTENNLSDALFGRGDRPSDRSAKRDPVTTERTSICQVRMLFKESFQLACIKIT